MAEMKENTGPVLEDARGAHSTDADRRRMWVLLVRSDWRPERRRRPGQRIVSARCDDKTTLRDPIPDRHRPERP